MMRLSELGYGRLGVMITLWLVGMSGCSDDSADASGDVIEVVDSGGDARGFDDSGDSVDSHDSAGDEDGGDGRGPNDVNEWDADGSGSDIGDDVVGDEKDTEGLRDTTGSGDADERDDVGDSLSSDDADETGDVVDAPDLLDADDSIGAPDTDDAADSSDAIDVHEVDGASDVGDAGASGDAVDSANPSDSTNATDSTDSPLVGDCISGASGTHAVRFRWLGNGANSTAYVSYEVNELPDQSRWHVGAYGRNMNYTPVFDDVFLGEGGLELSGSNFIDIELSTAGLASINEVSIGLYGRSFATGSPGSFGWTTVSGGGATPSGSMSNSAPYEWYRGDATSAFVAGDDGILLRIESGPPSNRLVVNAVELCFHAGS